MLKNAIPRQVALFLSKYCIESHDIRYADTELFGVFGSVCCPYPPPTELHGDYIE